MSGVIVARLLSFAMVVGFLIVMDISFVPVNENDLYVPRSLEALRARKERKDRAKKQREAAAMQAVEVEKALYLLDGALEGLKLDPNDPQVTNRLERLRGKVGDAGGSARSLSEDNLAEQDSDDSDVEDDSESSEDEENENGAAVIKKPLQVNIKPKSAASSSAIAPLKIPDKFSTLQQRMSQLEDPEADPEKWAAIRDGESSSAMAAEMETWITQGKTKRLGFDVFYDPLSGTSQLVRSKKQQAGGPVESEKETEPPKAQPGDAQRRFIRREKPEVPTAMTTFLQGLRTTRTYSHITKAVDAERRLKSLGYKQSTAGGKLKVLFQGNFGESCPAHFDEKQISFCNYYLPLFREQEQQQLLQMQERALKNQIPSLQVENFFPLTWRLYKQMDRRALRTRTQNESLQNEGGPYVNKFTFSHGAGKPSLTQKMYNQLKKSDESTKHQTQEAKQKMIVQVYCNNPYLFEGKKFIIRTWAVVISSNPMMVLYHDGAILRSVVPYSPFTKRDGHYKRAAHFTNDQSTHKGTLRSSELYASLGQFQHWLNTQHKETPTFVRDSLRPRIKARMIYALYAMMRPAPRTKAEMDDEDENEQSTSGGVRTGETEGLVKKQIKLPNDVAVVQPICFDFLLQEGAQNLYMLGAHANGACAVNLGGDSFRPPWKVAMQTALSDRLVDLGEEMLWRKVANVKLEKLTDLITDLPLDVLIDESLPGWSYIDEVNWYLSGGHVEGGLGGRDVVEAIDASHDEKGNSGDGGDESGDGGGDSNGGDDNENTKGGGDDEMEVDDEGSEDM